jgi:hypothetical protein
MVPTLLAMRAMQILSSSSVAAAAGSMIWLSFALSPSITLLPERPAPVDASGNITPQTPTTETMGAAVASPFEHRWHASTSDIPEVRPHESLENGIDEISTLPVVLDAPKLAPTEQRDIAAASQLDERDPVKMLLPLPPTRPSDVCARYGLYRVDYTQNHHRYWRCLHPRRPLPPSPARDESPAASTPLLSRILSGAGLILRPALP